MPINIVERQNDIMRIVSHVEAFVWDPLTPVTMSINDYNSFVAMTTEEAEQTAAALLEAVAKVNGGI